MFDLKRYADKHTSRFTPTGTYQSIAGMPSAVINITANPNPPNFTVPDGFFSTLYNYMIHDLEKPRLVSL